MKTKIEFFNLLISFVLIVALSFFSCGGDDEPPPKTNPIEVDFIAGPVQGLVPLDVAFNNRSTGDIVSWHWDFGDGGTSNFENPSYTYDSSGQYTVRLTAIDTDGISHEKKRENYIIITQAQAPSSHFEVDATSGLARQTKFQFNNKSSGVIDEYLWDFGDGNTSTEENPIHSYSSFGNFTVTLRVFGPGGENSSKIDIKVDEILHIYEYELGPFWPTKSPGGDCDFAGNGPDVIVRAEVLDPIGLGINVNMNIYMKASETQSDWTTASSSWSYILRELPANIYMKDVITSNFAEYIYPDNDTAYDESPTYDLCRFKVMGDTNGNDICGTTLDDTHVILYNIECQVRVGPI